MILSVLFSQVAAGADPVTSWYSIIANVGVVGVVCVLLIRGNLRIEKSYLELRDDRDAWKETASIALSALAESQRSQEEQLRNREAQMEMHQLTNQLLSEIAAYKAGQQR